MLRSESLDPFEPMESSEPFDGVVGRGSVNYMLRNTNQSLVALTGQADFKASIIITACSITVTASLLGIGDTWPGALLTMAAFSLVSSLFATLAVMPKHRLWGPSKRPPRINVLFFGHFEHVTQEEYVERVAAVSSDDATVYRAIAADLWELGRYLERSKYRYLRLAYLTFWLGAATAVTVQVVHMLG